METSRTLSTEQIDKINTLIHSYGSPQEMANSIAGFMSAYSRILAAIACTNDGYVLDSVDMNADPYILSELFKILIIK